MHPRDAWGGQEVVDTQWEGLGYTSRPDYARAVAEYDAFVSALEDAGAAVEFRTGADGLTLDAIYVRDASIISGRGAVLCGMGKEARAGEPAAQAKAFERLGVPVLGAITGAGRVEGGDAVWLDADTLAVGLGYRTNAEGIRQLRELLGAAVDVLEVPLPHWRGPGDVFHLMSILSPIDVDLALVYSPLMPVVFRNALLERGVRLVEVPEAELDMGPNALALAPGRCLLEAANVETGRRLEAAGVDVRFYDGAEISRKGLGGPTCLTRPLLRDDRLDAAGCRPGWGSG